MAIDILSTPPAPTTAQERRPAPPVQANRVLPGFGLTLGYTLVYLCLIVLIPLSATFIKTFGLTWSEFVDAVWSERALDSYKLTFGASFAGATVNAVFGLIVAWVLTRYRFPGKRFFDAMVDLPFALPTAVAGISLAILYSDNGWVGEPLLNFTIHLHNFLLRFTPASWTPSIEWLLPPDGVHVANTPLGVFVALTFIGLPFVVRTLQPVMEDLEPELEEVAATLGASRLQTFCRIIFPALLPPLLTGFALAFARALGEFGSVIFIAGNIPYETEITSLLIYIQLGEYNYGQATAIAVVMLLASFILLLLINLLQRWARRRAGGI
jgi:sulfate transport system permease protein